MTMQEILRDITDDFFLHSTSSDIEGWIKQRLLDSSAVENKRLAYEPASEPEIVAKEKDLGITLPPSYRNFLLTSNGFKCVSPFLDNLFSVEQVNWAKKTEEQWWLDMCIDYQSDVSDEEYFDYNDEQDTALCREEYIPQSLKVSEWYDGMCIFLNPVIKHGEEWEVLEYATWHPGIQRYRSFEEFLIKTHEMNTRLLIHRQTKNRS